MKYFDDHEEEMDGPIGLEMKGILVVTGVIILFFILFPAPILSGAAASSAAIFPG